MLPCDPENATFSSINLNDSILFKYDTEEEEYDYCKVTKYIGDSNNAQGLGCTKEDFDQTKFVDFDSQGCTKILYNDFPMDSTIVTDLDLVCDKQFQVK